MQPNTEIRQLPTYRGSSLHDVRCKSLVDVDRAPSVDVRGAVHTVLALVSRRVLGDLERLDQVRAAASQHRHLVALDQRVQPGNFAGALFVVNSKRQWWQEARETPHRLKQCGIRSRSYPQVADERVVAQQRDRRRLRGKRHFCSTHAPAKQATDESSANYPLLRVPLVFLWCTFLRVEIRHEVTRRVEDVLLHTANATHNANAQIQQNRSIQTSTPHCWLSHLAVIQLHLHRHGSLGCVCALGARHVAGHVPLPAQLQQHITATSHRHIYHLHIPSNTAKDLWLLAHLCVVPVHNCAREAHVCARSSGLHGPGPRPVESLPRALRTRTSLHFPLFPLLVMGPFFLNG